MNFWEEHFLIGLNKEPHKITKEHKSIDQALGNWRIVNLQMMPAIQSD